MACGFVLRAGGGLRILPELEAICGSKGDSLWVSEDLRWSRAAIVNPSMRHRAGSTFKDMFKSHPPSPHPCLAGPSCPCLLPGPHLPWLPSAPLLTMGGTRDSVNKHGGPCPHSVQNGPELHGQQTPSCLPALYCPKCTAVNCAPVQC